MLSVNRWNQIREVIAAYYPEHITDFVRTEQWPIHDLEAWLNEMLPIPGGWGRDEVQDGGNVLIRRWTGNPPKEPAFSEALLRLVEHYKTKLELSAIADVMMDVLDQLHEENLK